MSNKKRIIIYLALILAIILLSKIFPAHAATYWDYWLPKLGACESRNNDDITTLDSNNKFSYGRYQFQEQTWKNYIKKYNLLPNAEVEEYMNFIHDGAVQRELAIRILSEKDGWKNWKWCAEHTGLKDYLRGVQETR